MPDTKLTTRPPLGEPGEGWGSVSRPAAEALEEHRRALTAYCYRMLGSGAEAEDAVQEAFVRAWRGAADLRDAAALGGWLYRIATNICLDMLSSAQRRARPMDLGPASKADAEPGAPLPGQVWVQPVHDDRVLPDGDPADVVVARESLRLAFVAALQHLPAKQRAVLVLRDVLGWRAAEVADLLDTTPASVTSALQRARATLSALDLDLTGTTATAADVETDLLARYVSAFEAYDIDRLVDLLHHDAVFSMPPLPMWVRGPHAVSDFMRGTGNKCRGSRLLPARANGGPAAFVYNPAPDGTFAPWALVVVECADGRITGLHHFLGARPESFGLPTTLGRGPA